VTASLLDPHALRRAAECLATGEPIAPDDVPAVAKALEGLLPTDNYARRDALLRQCRARFFEHHSNRHAATLLCEQLFSFRAGPWRRRRHEMSCPAEYLGSKYATFWEILRTVDAVPSVERVRKIFGSRDEVS